MNQQGGWLQVYERVNMLLIIGMKTSVSSLTEVYIVVALTGGLITLSISFLKIMRWINDRTQRSNQLFGVKASRGVLAIPSVVARMENLEHKMDLATQHFIRVDAKFESLELHLDNLTRQLDAVVGNTKQLQPNGGKSVADSINRIEKVLTQRLDQTLARIEHQLEYKGENDDGQSSSNEHNHEHSNEHHR